MASRGRLSGNQGEVQSGIVLQRRFMVALSQDQSGGHTIESVPICRESQKRVDAGLASINGVSIVPVEEFVELGEQMVEFRAESTANEIRRILSASAD